MVIQLQYLTKNSFSCNFQELPPEKQITTKVVVKNVGPLLDLGEMVVILNGSWVHIKHDNSEHSKYVDIYSDELKHKKK